MLKCSVLIPFKISFSFLYFPYYLIFGGYFNASKLRKYSKSLIGLKREKGRMNPQNSFVAFS